MRFPLRVRLSILYALVAIIGFVLLFVFGGELVTKQAENTAVNKLYKCANYLSASYKVNDGTMNQGQLESVAYSTDTEIWVVGLDGAITTHTGTENVPLSVSQFNPSRGIDGYYMIGYFYGCFKSEYVSVYAPLTTDIMPQGYVVLHYPYDLVLTNTDQLLLFAYIAYFCILILMLLAFILIDRTMIVRIKKIVNAGREYVNGNLSFPSDVKGRDELGDIALVEHELAKQVGTSGEYQHRFLANVSHDFRSPLTSIRGYMVAIQDGTIPPEMQSKYIDVVINETDRLTKLANGLIDMTQFENGVALNRTDFDINDLLRDMMPTFEGRMIEKDLSFVFSMETEQLVVNADRARIEQVLHNLIDNAIKFSVNDHTIDIGTHSVGDKAFISVTDHGIGIEKENLNKIWERFYKTDTSRGKDKKGTGLGLSIVREIIQAHGENIDVISTKNVGTEFIFSLPTKE